MTTITIVFTMTTTINKGRVLKGKKVKRLFSSSPISWRKCGLNVELIVPLRVWLECSELATNKKKDSEHCPA